MEWASYPDHGAPGAANMMDIIAQEPAIRLGAFLGVLLVVGACEARAPRRERTVNGARAGRTTLASGF